MTFTKNVHYNPDIERSVIGACLLEKTAFGKIYTSLNTDCFYTSGHQIVFETIKQMYINGTPIDSFTVVDQLMRVQGRAKIDNHLTDYFVVQLTNSVVSSAHIEYHAYLIKTMWMDRQIIGLTNGSLKLDGDIKKKITDLQTAVYNIQQKTSEHDWSDMTKLMVDLYRHQDEIKKTGGVGISCGIKTLDRENGGFHPGQMIVFGSRPSVGKSALIGSIALHMAGNKKVVGIISLEMSNTEIAARLAAIDTDTDFMVLYRSLYRDEVETQKVYNRIGKSTSTLPIFVTDKTNVDIIEIRSKADKLKSLHGLDCLIIDYLQLVDVPESYNRNRENEIAKISRYCKVMAKEMNIPVILLCQLNREVTKRTGDHRYPQLSDIRESGSIEQDADVVIFLHRDWMGGVPVNEAGESTEFQADLVVRKWRNGKNNFIVPMDFDPPKMKFTERVEVGNWVPVSADNQHDNK